MKTGRVAILLGLLALLFACKRRQEQPVDDGVVHPMGKPVTVGYVTYLVRKARWASSLGRSKKEPGTSFFLIDLSVQSSEENPTMFPVCELTDAAGSTELPFPPGVNVSDVPHALLPLERLSPRVNKRGTIVFVVPRKDGYRLRVLGGIDSSESTLIEITPE